MRFIIESAILVLEIKKGGKRVIGVLVLTHGEMADGLVSAVNLIGGEFEKFEAIGLYADSDIENYKLQVQQKVTDLDDGSGVLVFCDLFGATPYNTTAKIYGDLKDKIKYRSITGVNLPMILEGLFNRESLNLEELTDYILDVGKDGIKELFKEVMEG